MIPENQQKIYLKIEKLLIFNQNTNKSKKTSDMHLAKKEKRLILFEEIKRKNRLTVS